MTHLGERRLEQYVLDELDGPRRDAVEAHLATCAACRQRLADERALDEALVLSAGTAPADAAERSLAQLWATLDAEPALAAPALTPRPAARRGRRAALAGPWLSVAALLVVTATLVLWHAGDDSSSTPRAVDAERETARVHTDAADAASERPAEPSLDPGEAQPSEPRAARPATERAPPPAPAVLPGASLDPLRLESLRSELAADLTALELPADLLGEALTAAAEPVLAPLRRQAWPVDALLRSLALEGDAAVAPLALRLAQADPSLASVLAAALDLRPAEVLGLLERDGAPLARSTSLLRGLERVADPRLGDPALAGRAQRLIASRDDARARAATARLLDRAVDAARAAPAGVTCLADLTRHAPLDLALTTLLRAGREQALRDTCRAVFQDRVMADPEQALPLLVERLEDRGQVDPLLSFCVGTGLEGLAAPLLARLEADPGDDGVLATLVDLGGVEVALGLHRIGSDEQGRAAKRLSESLQLVLAGEAELLERLSLRLADEGSARLVALAEQLPAELRGVALRHGLDRWRDDAGGHGAALLTALARLGRPADGLALLEQLPSLAGSDLLALAWTTAARLERDAALVAYGRAGGDPQRLAAASRASGRRLAAGRRPPASLLDPLARDLARLALP